VSKKPKIDVVPLLDEALMRRHLQAQEESVKEMIKLASEMRKEAITMRREIKPSRKN
jgi:hypothetical protein